jgi:hypothetical protein
MEPVDYNKLTGANPHMGSDRFRVWGPGASGIKASELKQTTGGSRTASSGNVLNPIPAFVANLLPKIWRGKWLSPWGKKDLLSVRRHQEVVDCVNPLLNMRVVFGPTNDVIYSDAGIIIQVNAASAGTVDSSAMHYRGTYDGSKSYSIGDVVRQRNGDASSGTWVCVIPQLPVLQGGSPPVLPEPHDVNGTPNNWELLAQPQSTLLPVWL